ncbi:hypothetical protein QYF61_005800, partial [Mycteria americana]
MASSCVRGGLDWILGKISSPKVLSIIGTGCPGKWLSDQPWKYLKDIWMRITQVAVIALPGNDLAMVSTCLKTITRRNVATQTELPCKHTAIQVSGCGECLSLSLTPEGSRDNNCFQCNQVDDLLSLVAELKEEVERLRSIRECEREIDWWSHTLPSLRLRQQVEAPQEAEDPLPSCHQAEGRGPRRQGERKQVPARGGRWTPRPPSPSQLPLHNRYGALDLEGQANEDEDVGEDPSRGLPRVGNDEVAERSPKVAKRDFRALGRLVEGSGAQGTSTYQTSAGNTTQQRGKQSRRFLECVEDNFLTQL